MVRRDSTDQMSPRNQPSASALLTARLRKLFFPRLNVQNLAIYCVLREECAASAFGIVKWRLKITRFRRDDTFNCSRYNKYVSLVGRGTREILGRFRRLDTHWQQSSCLPTRCYLGRTLSHEAIWLPRKFLTNSVSFSARGYNDNDGR